MGQCSISAIIPSNSVPLEATTRIKVNSTTLTVKFADGEPHEQRGYSLQSLSCIAGIKYSIYLDQWTDLSRPSIRQGFILCVVCLAGRDQLHGMWDQHGPPREHADLRSSRHSCLILIALWTDNTALRPWNEPSSDGVH